MVLHVVLECLGPTNACRKTLRAGDVSDPLMTELDEVSDGHADPDVVVADDGRDRPIAGLPVYQDYLDAFCLDSCCDASTDFSGRQNHSVDMAIGESRYHCLGVFGLIVSVAYQKGETLLAQGRLSASHKRREKGILEVRYDDPDSHGACGAQTSGQRMGPVAQVFSRL
jgi:hypothetical protein